MQPAFIEWNELTSQSKTYFSNLLLIIFWTHAMFSGVYGRIHHVLNELITERSKRDRDRSHTGSWRRWRISEESVLNFPSALSIRTTITQLFQRCEVAVC
jgi:hypothetical protein